MSELESEETYQARMNYARQNLDKAISDYGIKADIKELEEDLRRIEACKIFARHKDRAVCIRISMGLNSDGKDQFIDYWVDDNSVVLKALEVEEQTVLKELDELKSKAVK